VLQCVAFTYALHKDELRIPLDGGWRWFFSTIGVLWGAAYVLLIWWCSFKAIDVEGPDGKAKEAETALMWGRCAITAFYALGAVITIMVHKSPTLWQSATPSRATNS